MNEAMTRKTMIGTILVRKGWTCSVSPSVRSRWEEEYPVAAGRIGRDARHHNPKRADYVFFVGRERVAVLEAKRDTRSEDEAEAQARFYAGGRVPRYYQERAVEAVIAKLGAGERRILLNLATGIGNLFYALSDADGRKLRRDEVPAVSARFLRSGDCRRMPSRCLGRRIALEAKQTLRLPSMEAIFDFYSDVQRRLYAA